MKTTKQAFTVLLALLFITGPAQALAQEAPGGQQATVQVAEDEELGAYLTDAEGMSLYLFESDSEGESTCYDACADAWPPLMVEGEPQAGAEVDEDMLGTMTREDGTTQVTYNGWPLYYFVQDSQPGDTEGQDMEGFGAEWYLVSPGGEKVESHSSEE